MKNKRSTRVNAWLKKLFIVFGIAILVGFGIALSVSFRLIQEGYRRYGVAKGTAMVPKSIFCKWSASSGKAEDICMGFLWGDEYKETKRNIFEQNIKWIIENSASLELLPITDFDWDTMYIFGPYTSSASINTQLGYPWIDTKSIIFIDKKTSISTRDDRNLLVFMKNNRVVFNIDLLRSIGDFEQDPSSTMFSPASAVFQVKKRNDGGTVMVHQENVLVKMDCPYTKYIPQEKNSKNTTCTLTTISGYSSLCLIVLDEVANGYILRIFGRIGDVKNIPQDTMFSLEFTESIPYDVDQGSVRIIDDSLGRTILKSYKNNKNMQIGFLHKDDHGYSLSWKN